MNNTVRGIWLLCFWGFLGNAFGLQINRTSSSTLYIDLANQMACNYAAYQITNNDGVAYSNLWVTIGSFSGSIVSLGGGDSGKFNVGSLGVNGSKMAFFYLNATGTTTTNQTHTISLYQGYPATGTLLLSSNFSLTVAAVNRNNANKINAIAYLPPQPVLGGLVSVTVDGLTGVLKAGDPMVFVPSSTTNWGATAFELTSTSITVTNGSTFLYTNQLSFGAPAQGQQAYHAQYWFRAVAATTSNTPVSPDGCFGTGNNSSLEHSILNSGVTVPAITSPTNSMLLSQAASVSQLYTNEILTYTIRVTNSGTLDVSLDRIVDTLPVNFSYLTNSSLFNGSVIGNPGTSAQTLTWSDGYTVPAGTSRSLSFQATAQTAGYTTNSVIGFTKDSQVDTTLATTDNVPARVTVRVLLAPTAVNDTGGTLEDVPLAVSAPGVLGNDSEPNGFTLTVLSYTQPSHGSVTVNANGSYTYAPATNYNGSDSFTYTLTNGNARASTATVSLAVTAVNDPPTLNGISDPVLNENAGLQTVPLTGISPGPADESSQTLAISASSSNPSLVPTPTVNYTNPAATGALTFTPAANQFGTAIITVTLQDNGGTANGGIDTFNRSFTVTVNPVNQPPTLDPISSLTLNEDGGLQTINLTGISPGPTNENTQTVTIAATSSNPSVVPAPAVQYASPNPTGTLTFTPVTNAFGTATITVVVQDNGGTANGGVNAATNTFTVTVNSVNDPPTLDGVSNLTLVVNAGLQTVDLTGISPGPTNETGQSLSITATSSDLSVIPNPTVHYTSPDSTGSLTFTPVAGATGTSTISVTVHDTGGTANGGVDFLTRTFEVTVQPLTNVWAPGGIFAAEMSDAAGPAGTGYTQTNYNGILDIQATSTNPFTVQLISLNGSAPGSAANFDNNTPYTWTIATASNGITGFDPSKFVVDASQFSNDLAGGVFGVISDGSSVSVMFTNNQPPVANPVALGRAWGTALRIPIANLLAGFTSDPDGDATALVGLGASTNGSPVSTNEIFILFSPTNNLGESFSYVIRDLRAYRAGDTVRTATNWITVSITNAVGTAQSIANSGGTVQVNFAGVPGYAYDVEQADNLNGPWTVVLTTNAPPSGVWQYLDPAPPQPTAFYRLKQH